MLQNEVQQQYNISKWLLQKIQSSCVFVRPALFHSPSYYWVTSLEIVKEIKSGRAVKSKKKKKKP